jgi:anti-sigma B factor antagonist
MNGVTILDLVGRFAIGSRDPESAPLRALIGELVGQGRVVVLMHAGGLADLDAHGIGELVWSVNTLRRSGGQMALIAPSPRVRRMLTVTRLNTVFAIYDSEVEAIGSTRWPPVPGGATYPSVCLATGA